MSLMAVAFPILPGKTPQWRTWMQELNGPRREDFARSRSRAGVHERTYLQQTPMGDLVIVTLEGQDPGHAFERMMGETDPFTTWFLGKVKEIHGLDLSTPMRGSPSEMVVDTEAVPALAR
jgi:hypothetical protein